MAFSLPETDAKYPQFKPHMQAVYGALVQVMPVFLRSDSSFGLKDRANYEAQFKTLADQSKAIQVIVEGSDVGHKSLAAQLASSTDAAYAQFKSGNASQTRFFLSEALNSCFGCHSSRGTEKDSTFVTNFNKDLKLEGFEPLARARFLVLSRQFDGALKEYERLLVNSSLSLDDLINVEPFVEYMILGIRVKNSTDEVSATFAKLKDSKLPELLKNDIKNWSRSLQELKKEKISTNSLREAEKQIALAQKHMEYPQDRSGLVRMIVASRILHEVVLSKSTSASDKAKAYYELGLTENLIGSEFFSDEPLAYFEEAMKLAPKSAIARKAYAQYEDIVRFNYSGSSGTKLPAAETKKLEDLRLKAF